ncbi:ORF V: Enzymatic polyprotein [Labeo rohita]|uniref:ORF V: Enzymatic polyprotein n=1 Tax=Labeo rohita TaxID=84645 RepID=A0ABQ8L9I2_LABRO|nr:ORF V: Enzymatic polyprotein [Labeo rohita]
MNAFISDAGSFPSVEEPLFDPGRCFVGGVSLRNVVTMDRLIPDGLGSCFFQGRLVNGHWTSQLCNLHINLLKLMAVFLALKHFLPFLKGFHVLVRTDNMKMVGCIISHQVPRGPKCRCGSPIMGQSIIRRIGTSSISVGSYLGEIWQGCC